MEEQRMVSFYIITLLTEWKSSKEPLRNSYCGMVPGSLQNKGQQYSLPTVPLQCFFHVSEYGSSAFLKKKRLKATPNRPGAGGLHSTRYLNPTNRF